MLRYAPCAALDAERLNQAAAGRQQSLEPDGTPAVALNEWLGANQSDCGSKAGATQATQRVHHPSGGYNAYRP